MQPAAPLFSVIVPTYARPRQLALCLEALAGLDFSHDQFEVVVVDDGSPTPPREVTASFADRLSITLLTQPNAGPGAARNTGAAHARGQFLAFTDDDCTPEKGWLSRLEAAFREAPDCLLGGRTVNRLTGNAYAAASQVIVDAAYAFYNDDSASARFFASNNMAVPADRFRQSGGFDVAFRIASEDRELCDRWRHTGGRLVYVPDAVVFHAHPLTFLGFCRQHFSYGRGARRYHRLRARRRSGRLSADMGFHARLPRLVRPSLSRLPWRQAAVVVGLLGVWQVANALGFFYEGCRSPASCRMEG